MIRLIATFLTLLLLASCSKKEHFTVEGEIEGLGSQSVSMTYYADGGIKTASCPAGDGRFVMRGMSATPTLCIVEVANVGDIAVVVAADGDNIRLKGKLGDPLAITAEGNSTSAKISAWTAANADIIRAGNAALINRSIARFVADNPKDMASAALMATRFQTPGFESMADSIIATINPAARPAAVMQNFNALLASQLTRQATGEVRMMMLWGRNDTIIRLHPASHTLTLIAFRNPGQPNDTVAGLLRESSGDYPRRRLGVFEISTARDSALWKTSTARDSATWVQTWAPGSVALPEVRKLNVPRIPFFIIADSLGTQLYRGSSTDSVRNLIRSRLGAPIL